MNTKIDKWIRWIDQIRYEASLLFYFRKVFNQIKDIYFSNESIRKIDKFTFWEFEVNGYYGIIVMGIRRQLKIDDNSISLVKLLNDISENSEILTRKYFLSFYSNENDSIGNEVFDEIFGINSNCSNPKIINNHIADLKNKCDEIEKFADKRIAHLDKKKGVFPPSFIAIDNGLQKLEDLIKKYYLLLKGTDISTVEPFNINQNWIDIFKQKWIY